MKTTLEVLKGARDKISSPSSWCQGASAMSSDGQHVGVMSPKASSWCAFGALQAVRQWVSSESCLYLMQQIRLIDNKITSIHEFNDSRSHDEVLAVFDKAIDALLSEVG